jgi:transposase
MARKAYPSDVTDEEWHFVAPYLTLMTEDAPQRQHDLREVFNALRWMVRSGSPWRYLPVTSHAGKWFISRHSAG